MNLRLEHESGGHRHYLDGRPIHCGTQLEMQLGGARGPWVAVRYEANLGKEVSVCLYAVGGRIYPDQDATFRWPAC
jgi:hypothetical protein